MLDRNIRFAAECGKKAEGSLLAASGAILYGNNAAVKMSAGIWNNKNTVSLIVKTGSHKVNGGVK